MSEKIIILKQTKKGYEADTVYSASDSLNIHFSGKQYLELKDTPIDVNTPGKDWFDYALGTITILGAIIAAFYTWKSIRKLYQKDEDKQAQIDKLSSIAEKMEAQNAILEEANLLISKQVDALRNLTIGTNDNETSKELLKIEREKLELEHRPRLYSNMFSTAMSTGKFQIENGGKPLTIERLECSDENIIIEQANKYEGFFLEEHGIFTVHTRTLDGNVMNDKKYTIKIYCKNEIEIKYLIELDSNKMDSLRKSKKLLENE